ncbi:hypothetical protein RND81_04G052000 [Saponaria officinalis]|uniref:Fe2OG dioxygenase domain-containing protein n=1 Tax=Saponaria officinalis TaxID=3572 RepID=A0AAW1LJ40_SAPOF
MREISIWAFICWTNGVQRLVNHGIENSTLDQVLQVTRQFFDLSLKEKEKYARYVSQNWKLDQMEGYGCDRMSEGQAFNWCDRLFLVLHPESRRKPQYWPDESIPKFREIVDDYLNGLIRIREILLKSISKMLNLPEEYLISKYGNDGFIATRFNLYPTSPYPDRILGSRRHTDINLFTILLLDKEVEGLHVEKDEQWYIVPIVPNALVFNIADMLEIITNGSVKSPCHRVVTDAERERLSIVSAFGPAPNSEIGPLEELIDEENPIRYPTLKNSSEVAADYFANGKIFIKEIRKFGAHILDQEREELNKET